MFLKEKKKPPKYLPKWLHRSAFPPAVMRVPVAPHPQQHLVVSGFWIFAILIDVEWYLIMVSICNSLTIFSIFSCLFDICIFFFLKVSFQIFAHF